MYRQWDRTITDNLLYRVLPLMKETRINKSTLYCVDLKQLKVPPPCKHQKLGLVVKNNLLISCFWIDGLDKPKSSCEKRKSLSNNAIHIKRG